MCPDDLSGGAADVVDAEQLVGTWRRFGAAGPIYEIIGTGPALPDGDRLMRVRLPETAEEADYRISHLAKDPREA